MFGAPLIKRVLNHFVPDEFCPDPVPVSVLEALESAEVRPPFKLNKRKKKKRMHPKSVNKLILLTET